MMNLEDFICEYDCCKLILEDPVTLPCGNTLCLEHLNKFNDKFICYFCKGEHQIPVNGFLINKKITKMIENHFNFNTLRNKIKTSFEELSESIEEYENINPGCFVFDYFADIRNKVDLHREELKKEIDERSDEIIRQLNEKEEKCKANLSKIEKTNLDELKNDNLPAWKQKLRKPNENEVDLYDFAPILNDIIQIVKKELSNLKNSLLDNESIKFEKYDKSSLFGELIIENYFKAFIVKNLK